MYTYSFEKLEVWRLSRKLIVDIYSITKGFPSDERFCMTNQIRRAAISIASNLAEGTSRKTSKDKANFTQIAFSSLMEVLNDLIISTDLGFMNEKSLPELRKKIDEIGNKLNALRIAQLKK
jgi:four helix bundle protein